MDVEKLTKAQGRVFQDLVELSSELHTDGRVPTEVELRDTLNNPHVALMVIRDGERIVGMASLYVIQKLGKRSAQLEDVVVKSEYRGQGLGKKLVAAIIEEAKKRGVDTISLTSRPERVAAHKLYESAGFVKRDTTVFKLKIS